MLHRLTLAALLSLAAPAQLLAQDVAATEGDGAAAPAAPGLETFAAEGPLALDTVVARVGGTEITMGHVLMAHMDSPEPYNQMPISSVGPALVQQLVQQEELSQAFDGSRPAATRYMLENTERRAVATDAMMEHLGEVITEDRIAAAYDEQYGGDAEAPLEYHAAHILVETEEEAQDLIAQYEDGTDFAKLARDNSTGPSGPNGGDLGWFTADKMVPAFSTAVAEMEPDTISAPVQTEYGWHVIKLIETRQEKPTLEEVRPEIVQQLQQSESAAYLDDLMQKSDASTVDFGTLDLGDQEAVMDLYMKLQE